MLPDLEFSEWKVEGNNIFFKTSNEIKRVVSQGISASIKVKLPGYLTHVFICFPVPSLVRFYVSTLGPYTNRTTFYYIGQWGEGDKFYRVLKRVKYRYGMELPPWMYEGYLKTNMREIKSRIVHYVIENCSSGFDGILLKFRDEFDSKRRYEEWLKIFWFEAGNDFLFGKEKEKNKILELVPIIPKKINNLIFWQPPEGWDKFKKIKTNPAKIKMDW